MNATDPYKSFRRTNVQIFIISATSPHCHIVFCIILSYLVLPFLGPAGIVWKNGRHVHQGDAAQRIEKSESSQWPFGKTDGSPDSGARGVQRDN